jgi:tetratricopeptide (TPR) repeat protein
MGRVRRVSYETLTSAPMTFRMAVMMAAMSATRESGRSIETDATVAPATTQRLETDATVAPATTQRLETDATVAPATTQRLEMDATVAPASQPSAAKSAGPVIRPPVKAESYRDFLPVDRGHYIIGDQIARGGMGRIIAAHDRRLDRPVAIKELIVQDPGLLARFEREARITARLQHPSIVSIHEAGKWPSGEPFFAMKLVAGRSLDVVIDEQATLAGRLALIPSIIAAVDALAYAHSKNIVHRDLKPGNILVGDFGETVVIDWGLAKDLGDKDDVISAPARPGVQEGETVVGSVLGTPAYMPLEQAKGDRVDQRADVYALGAILYHVLVGEPPYTGRTTDQLLLKLLSNPPAPVELVVPAAPKDLVTIVGKAMERDANDRYPSAKELVDDLKKFQTGQLVGAHRYSNMELVRRWVRRHRTAVTVGAALLAVLAVVSTISVQRIMRERSEAEAARAKAEEQRTLAVASRSEAEELMGFMLGDLKEKLQPVGKLEIIDAVAKQSMAYYARQPDTGTDEERRKRAQAFMNVGDVLVPQGNLEGGLAAYRAALAIREALATHPTSYGDQGDVAAARYKIGDVIATRGDGSEALAEYRAGIVMAGKAAAGDPKATQFQHQLSVGHDDIGDVLLNTGDIAGALVEFRASMAIRTQLVAAEPANTRWLRNLYISHNKVGTGLLAKGDLESALGEFRVCLSLQEKLFALDPKNAILKRELTVGHNRIGDVLVMQGKVADALREYRASLALAEEIVAHDPQNTNWIRDSIVAHHNIGTALSAGGDAPGALAAYRAALAAGEGLVKLDPANAEWRRDTMITHQKIASHLRKTGDLTGSLAENAKSLAMVEALVKADPDNLVYQADLAANHNMIGNVLSSMPDPKKVAESVEQFEQSSAIFGRLSAKDPDNISYLRGHAMSLVNLGDAYATLVDQKAIEPYRKALPIFDVLVKKQPSNHESEQTMAMVHYNIGDLLSKTQPDAALAELRRADSLMDTLLKIDPKNAQWLAMQAEIKKHLPKP